MLIKGLHAGVRMHRDEFRRDDLPFLAVEEETIACVPNGQNEPFLRILICFSQLEAPEAGPARPIQPDVRRPSEDRPVKNPVDPLLA